MARHRTILSITLAVIALLATTAAAQTTTTTQTPGAATVTTEQMNGEVVEVQGNNLIVRMSNGELRTFNNIPDSRRATIDGREVGVRDLKPGTRLSATISKTTTPVTVRTVTVGTGKVWHVSGNTVILTLPNGQNRQYVVKPDYRFTVSGKPATVTDLRAGMNVSAEKIVEEPIVEIAMDTKVVGQAPAPSAQPAPVAAAPAPAPRPAPAAAPAPVAEEPAELPRTASQLPLTGLLGLLLVGSSYMVRLRRRSS